MNWILLPLAAIVGLSAPVDSEYAELPPEFRPCDGTVPVFNPEACPGLQYAPERANPPREAPCGDRIQLVREANGYPRIENLPASPDRPYMIAAVDKRVDGCAVMQMHGDASDIRPLPLAPEHDAMLHKAN